MSTREKYYVYVHKKPNNNEIFYIGKGKGGRAYKKTGRNNYWNNIVKKNNGFLVEIFKKNLAECEAFELEKILIKKHKIGLCNLTDGGEGVSGFVPTENCRKITGNRYKGKKLSKEHRKKISNSHRGKKLSEEHKKKLSTIAKGKESHLKGSKLTDKHKNKISKSMSGKKHPRFGKRVNKKIREKISKSTTGSKNHISKKVHVYDLKNQIIINFDTSSEASKKIGVSTTTLRNYFKSKKPINEMYLIKYIGK
jgi:hypothetical protein